MSYQVLARKWRPGNFREMVGQEHVLRALVNALDHNRLHHAYLFTGTRGVGKTTIARILAKCLNCEAGVTSTPCGECSSCVEISEGRFVDLIEVDAASRTKVEDTRELLDNVQYAPTRGRYKIYLIDEVHMLSNSSFNALLKTLEEPPEHVKFLLATTDPQKLPVTILSRCLQFNLKNMSPERIVGHLQQVLEKEAVPFDENALWLLARSADGSMRDGLSLTDQAISFGNGKIGEADVASMLGTIDHQLIQNLMGGLIEGDGKKLLDSVAKFAEHAPDFNGALADLLTLLHRIAIAQALPEALDNSFGDRKQILQFASALAAEDVQLFYQTALIGRRDLHLAPEPRSGFEMTLLRMLAFKPQGVAEVPTQALSAQSHTAQTDEQTPEVATETTPAETNAGSSAAESSIVHAPVDSAALANGSSEKLQTEEQSPEKKPLAETTTVSPETQSAQGVVSVQQNSSTDYNELNPPPIEHLANEPLAAAPQTSAPAQTTAVEPSPAPSASAHRVGAAATMLQGAPSVESIAEAKTAAPVAAKPELINEAKPKAEPKIKPPVKPGIAELKDQIKAITGKEGITATAPKPAALQPSVAEPAVTQNNLSQANTGVQPAADKLSIEQLTPQTWTRVFKQLGVKGIVQNTASNCALLGTDGSQLFFALDESRSGLFDNSHSQRLTAMLSDYFGLPVKVDINLQPLPHGVETPALCAEREKKERHQQALQSLADDPIVKTLEREFGAVLDQQSVTVKG